MTNYPNLKLATGELINTQSGKRTVGTDINKAFTITEEKDLKSSKDLKMVTRRFLDDLPVPPLQSRPIAIVLGYSSFGLNDADIASILSITAADVRSIRESDEYSKFLEGVLQNIREHDANVVRKKLNKEAENAATKIANLVDYPDAKVALAAAKDILDRNNIKGTEIVEHRHEGAITFRYIDDAEKKTSKEVDVGF